jgi:hypothetical protein
VLLGEAPAKSASLWSWNSEDAWGRTVPQHKDLVLIRGASKNGHEEEEERVAGAGAGMGVGVAEDNGKGGAAAVEGAEGAEAGHKRAAAVDAAADAAAHGAALAPRDNKDRERVRERERERTVLRARAVVCGRFHTMVLLDDAQKQAAVAAGAAGGSLSRLVASASRALAGSLARANVVRLLYAWLPRVCGGGGESFGGERVAETASYGQLRPAPAAV